MGVVADVFPASFCAAGTLRLYREFGRLPTPVAAQVFKSLEECCVGRDEREVWTAEQHAELRRLLDTPNTP